MHRKEGEQLRCRDQQTVTTKDLMSDNVMDMFSMSRPAATSSQVHYLPQDLLSSLSLEADSEAANDEFADFQSCPKSDNLSNGANYTEDFDDFVTAISSPKIESVGATGSLVDRYDVFRDLDSDRASHVTASPAHESDQRVLMWHKCLVACKQLLHKSFNALIVNHGEDSVIEALRSEAGHRFMQDLRQVFCISHRIGEAVQSSSLCSIAPLQVLCADVQMIWRPLHSLFNKVSPDQHSKEDSDAKMLKERGERCYICLQHEPPDVVIVQAIPYHKSCVNLWIHYLQSPLPTSVSVMNRVF